MDSQHIRIRTFPYVVFLHIAIIYPMDKHKFIRLAGSQSELARILGIKQPSVAQWKTVPQARIWQLKLLRPEWFDNK